MSLDSRPSRIVTLDILRGVAVMGILAMNAAAFAMPEPAYFNPAAYGGAEGIDLVAWTANFILFDGKMRGLFALLFGASMLLVIERAAAKGESEARVHYRRMLWLLAFGAAHFYLLWWGDILFHYALIGMIAFLFRNAGVRALAAWIAVLLALDLMVMIGTSAAFLEASAAAARPGADAAAVSNWALMKAEFGPMGRDALAADLALYCGSYPDMIRHRFAEGAGMPFFMLLFGGFETLAMMLIGMAGLRSGFLTGAWETARYRAVALWGLGIGGAAFAIMAALVIRSGFEPAIVVATAFAGSVIPRLLMVLGYAALIILLTWRGGPLVQRIAAAGRAAFTNYLGTSLAMTFLFQGWGLGLYGSLSRAELWLAVTPIWLVMLLWSKPWLDRYRYGPFEWLWRSLARGRPQPMRKADSRRASEAT